MKKEKTSPKMDTVKITPKKSTPKFVDKQLENQDKTGLASYIVYTNGKIVINKNNWNDEIVKNNGMLRSNSMGKSLIAYVTGHAVCKYGLNLNKKSEDNDLPGSSLLQIASENDNYQRIVLSEYHAAASPVGAFMLRKGKYKYV